MLARVDPELLDCVEFPLGTQTKEATRAEAERAGLAAAERAPAGICPLRMARVAIVSTPAAIRAWAAWGVLIAAIRSSG